MTDSPATIVLQIQEIVFSLKPRYKAGHVITAGEAVALNRALAQNLQNNFSARIKRAKAIYGSELSQAQLKILRDSLDDYAAVYEFKISASRAYDPVEKEAWRIAKAAAIAKLRFENSEKPSDEDVEALAEELLENRPQIREEAARRIAAAQAVAAEALDLV